MNKEDIKELQEYNLKYLEARNNEEIFGGDYTSEVELEYVKKENQRLQQELDKYKNIVEDLEIVNEEHRLLNGMLREENNKLKKLIITLQKNIMELDCSDEELELLNSILQGIDE